MSSSLRSNEPESTEMRVDVGPTSLRVVVRGEGEPLVLFNGLGAHIAMWGPFATELARTRKVVMFDAPGCGASPATRRPRRMHELTPLIARLLDDLQIESADMLGYSWGGALLQQFAHDYPERVRRLVLASTTPGLGGQPPSLKVLGIMSTPLRYLSPTFMEHAAPHLYGGANRRLPGERPRTTERWFIKPPSTVGYTRQLYAISGWTSLRWLRKLPQRVLVLCGDDDPLVPVSNARLIARSVPDSRLHIAPGAGHLWLIGREDQSVPIIEAFLSAP